MDNSAVPDPAAGGRVWNPIELPRQSDVEFDSPNTRQLVALAAAWKSQREKLMASSPSAYSEFVARLIRSWAIETGILERLYDLDEGATQTLVEHGLRVELVERGSSSLPAERLIAVLKDHVDAANMVQDLVRDGRILTKHFIRELHHLLTRLQDETEGMTSSGQVLSVALAHGRFKTLPNNPLRADGTIHEYCPPEQVESEVDSLLAGYEVLQDQSTALRAAWLHHRFTQIHPFQDGNGRVARALANLVFISDGLFPLVVSRGDRSRYLDALEEADGGDLTQLIDLFAEIESGTLVRALGAADAEQQSLRGSTVDAIVGRIADRTSRKIKDRESVLRGVDDVARDLRDRGAVYLEGRARQVVAQLESSADIRLQLLAPQLGGNDAGNADWWKFQLISIAQELGYWINFNEAHHWFRLSLRNVRNVTVNLQLVVSLHHFGQELGIVRATAFAEYEPAGSRDREGAAPHPSERQVQNCTPTLFTVTYLQGAEEAAPDFERWLEEALAVGLRKWSELL